MANGTQCESAQGERKRDEILLRCEVSFFPEHPGNEEFRSLFPRDKNGKIPGRSRTSTTQPPSTTQRCMRAATPKPKPRTIITLGFGTTSIVLLLHASEEKQHNVLSRGEGAD